MIVTDTVDEVDDDDESYKVLRLCDSDDNDVCDRVIIDERDMIQVGLLDDDEQDKRDEVDDEIDCVLI